MTTLIIIRHGFSKNNKEKRYSGQFDVPLDEIGIKQAHAAAKYINENFNVDKIYSSDLSRAYNTAKPLSELCGLPIITNERLREINVGSWQNMLVSDIEKIYPEDFKLHKEHPELTHFGGGESYGELMERSSKILSEIAEENDGKTVAIATHGAFIRSLLCSWKGIPIEQINHPSTFVSNASITIVNYENGKPEFIKTGFVGHLENITH